MPAPEINVRLTADGVQDVVNAFKRVQQEEKATVQSSGLLGQAMEQLGELMPIVSIGVLVEKTVELGKQALDSAVSIGKLAQETGSSAGTLSVLAMAAHDVGIEQEQLSNGILKLAKNQEAASNGNAKAKKAFDDLKISMTDIRTKNPSDMFIEIAQHLQTDIPEGAQRAAVAADIFGQRIGARLIPVLDEIGKSGGFDELEKKARSLGLYISDEFVAQAKQGEEELKNMEDITHGFAMQFVAGLLPEAAKGMDDLNRSVSSGGSSAFKTLGDIVGNVGRGILNVFLTVGQTIAVVFESILQGAEDLLGTLDRVGQATQKSDWRGAWNAVKEGASDFKTHQGAVWGSYGQMIKSEWTAQPAAPEVQKPSGRGTGGSGSGQSADELKKLADARAAFWDTVHSSELEKQKQADAAMDAQEKTYYQAGLESLTEYYDNRAARIQAEADAEKAILQKKLDDEEAAAAKMLGKSVDFVKTVVAQGPAAVQAAAGANAQALAMLGKVEQTKAKIDEADLNRQKQLQENDAARSQAQFEASQKLLADRQKLYQLEGNTSAAQQLALERELADTEQLLIKLGVAESERQAILARTAANAMARAQLGGLSQQGGDALSSLQEQIAAIQDKASTGAISELDATAQIYNLEKQRLPNLQQIASQMADVVDIARLQLAELVPGTEAYDAQLAVVNNLQRQADEYAKSIGKIGAGLKNTTSISVQFSNLMAQQGFSDIVNFFDAIDTGQKSASQAFADLGKDFEQMITHMIDQMIVYYTLMALVGWLAPNSSLYTSLSKSGPFGGMTGHANGGWTGNAATNKVTGVVHGKEFVVKAGPAEKFRPLLEAMNAGIGSVSNGSSFAGMAGNSDAANSKVDPSAIVQVNIQNQSGAPVSQQQRSGAGGGSIIDVVIGQVAADIAGGGKVGQTIQSTYGVSRKGNVRG
jgi:hypothetical protein